MTLWTLAKLEKKWGEPLYTRKCVLPSMQEVVKTVQGRQQPAKRQETLNGHSSYLKMFKIKDLPRIMRKVAKHMG